MKTDLEIRTSLHHFLTATFPALQSSRLTDSTPLLEGGAVDSLGLLEIVTFLEQDFGLKLDDEDVVVENFESIQSIESLVRRKLTSNVPA